MSAKLQIVALFCEDIREEKAGTESLIGVLPENVDFPQLPVAVPKLAFYVRIHAPIDHPMKDVRVSIIETTGARIELGHLEEAIIEQSQREALANGAPYAGTILRGVASPFNIAKPGRMFVVVSIGGEEHVAGSMKIGVSSESVQGSRVIATGMTPNPAL